MKIDSYDRYDRLINMMEEIGLESGEYSALSRLLDCGTAWNGRYTCRSPACPKCRRANIESAKQRMQETLADLNNDDMSFLTVVLRGTSDIDNLDKIITSEKTRLRNRIRAGRMKSADWNDVAVYGWVEIDAVSADFIQAVAPERRDLLLNIANVATASYGPTWFPSFHAIVYHPNIAPDEFQELLKRVWPLESQIDLLSFKPNNEFSDNVNRIVSYVNKFTCTMSLCADVKGGKLFQQWPAMWEAQLTNWLHQRRSAFEMLRFSIRQKRT